MICYAKTLDATLKGRKGSWLNGSSRMDLLIMQVSPTGSCIYLSPYS